MTASSASASVFCLKTPFLGFHEFLLFAFLSDLFSARGVSALYVQRIVYD
jgi:hypothetical protein